MPAPKQEAFRLRGWSRQCVLTSRNVTVETRHCQIVAGRIDADRDRDGGGIGSRLLDLSVPLAVSIDSRWLPPNGRLASKPARALHSGGPAGSGKFAGPSLSVFGTNLNESFLHCSECGHSVTYALTRFPQTSEASNSLYNPYRFATSHIAIRVKEWLTAFCLRRMIPGSEVLTLIPQGTCADHSPTGTRSRIRPLAMTPSARS